MDIWRQRAYEQDIYCNLRYREDWRNRRTGRIRAEHRWQSNDHTGCNSYNHPCSTDNSRQRVHMGCWKRHILHQGRRHSRQTDHQGKKRNAYLRKRRESLRRRSSYQWYRNSRRRRICRRRRRNLRCNRNSDRCRQQRQYVLLWAERRHKCWQLRYRRSGIRNTGSNT